jgi:uncharacterized protein (TIGR02687 family)
MDTKEINNSLDRIFNEEGSRIVFWNDPDAQFQSILPSIAIEGVSVLHLDQMGTLEVKIRLEREDPVGKFLLYSPTEEPDYENDWLLDIRLYSQPFRADKPSILLNQLGLLNHHLRQHLAERRKFFDNKDRLNKLKALIAPDDTAMDLDRKILAVVVKADQPEFFNIVRTMFHAWTEGDVDLDLDSPPPVWEQVEKYDLAQSFWDMAKAHFGYDDQSPTLKKFLLRLLVTDFVHYLKPESPSALSQLVLPPQGQSNTVVCLAQWRDSSSRASSYDRLSAEIATLINLDELLQGYEITDLLDVMTFLGIEQAIASQLRLRVQSTAETLNPEDIRLLATRRQAGHWASPTAIGAAEVPRTALHEVYSALVAAADFFALRSSHLSGFDFADALSLYRAYENELYRFDQLYRHFCEAADHAEAQGWNILKPLRDDLEGCYANWFLPTMGLAWGGFVDPRGSHGLLNTWRLDQVPNQHQFFESHVKPRLDEAENRRAFVIISDAFRYEAAQELAQELNGTYRLEATLTSQLGVLPSYTVLGMASLLPHKTLTYKPNGEVLVDSKSTAGTENRNEILTSFQGLACMAADLLAMKKEQGREFVKDQRLVYVYHKTVDDVGEKIEDKTFEGVRTAINELAALVAYIINNLNGNHVILTADHGFLFAESPPGEPEKSKLDQKPVGTVVAKKRYLIGHHLPDHEAAWHGNTSVTAGAEGDMEFWIPRSVNRFHFSGGAKFVHGGAMLQEIVVPVITIRHKKDKGSRGQTKVKTVAVHVLGSSHKITANSHRFELIQTEPVSDRVKAVTLKVAVYDGEEPVTNVESVTFDSSSDKMDERKKWIRLTLQDRECDKNTNYRLVLRDAETGIEQQSIQVIIDRAFRDDF